MLVEKTTYISVGELGWVIIGSSSGLSPSASGHYPNQCWLIGNYTLRNKFRQFSIFLANLKHFHCRKCNWKKYLQNGGDFVQASLCWRKSWELSKCQLCRHWRHRRLSWRQPPTSPVTAKLASWQLLVYQVWHDECLQDYVIAVTITIHGNMFIHLFIWGFIHSVTLPTMWWGVSPGGHCSDYYTGTLSF